MPVMRMNPPGILSPWMGLLDTLLPPTSFWNIIGTFCSFPQEIAMLFFNFPKTRVGTRAKRPSSSASSSVHTKLLCGWPTRLSKGLLDQSPTPERCLEAFHLQRTRFELIVERKLRRRQLTDDGNVEITGRDLRERTPPVGQSSLFETAA